MVINLKDKSGNSIIEFIKYDKDWGNDEKDLWDIYYKRLGIYCFKVISNNGQIEVEEEYGN